ncbi:MAG TPA: hydroxysqualene dehydroxylase HpnE [Xanthobacteraceae bacterium]|nr:hydroxysqualene dehydroxylase HpnE [Xanthobacteraceae bacterium]
MPRTIHIIGAGLAGLAAAVALSKRGRPVVLHEATTFAGGRCRSYHDAALDMTIDNGNHLLLSANRAALAFLRDIGAAHRLPLPPEAAFHFIDLKSRERWTLRMNAGRVPWWILDSARRVPGTRALDYLKLAPLLFPPARKPIAEVIACSGPLYDRLVQPVLLAALNIAPPLGSAKLAGAVIRETLAAGGAACRPLIAREGLGITLIEPALAYLAQQQAEVRLGHQLHALRFAGDRVAALDFGTESITLAQDDTIVLAVPPYAATALVPDLEAPNEFRAIVNAHFRIEPPPGQPAILGVINATTEWIFAFAGRLSVTVSAGDRLIDTPRETLARTLWDEVKAATGLSAALPPWQIVRERRATFAATPAQDARRPGAGTRWRNLVLAGDWTDTGLPATIEGAIRSGNRAAELVAQS